ncbi:MAG: hypothetical protein ACEQSH_00235 [Bacteroidia bacterium]
MTDTERLDILCAAMPTAEAKNALHACRDGHPLGRDNPIKWRNAESLVSAYIIRLPGPEWRWLRVQAADEARAATEGAKP